jgi:peptidoglycan/LPS O-acetylase OafA/YrhL
MPSSPSPSRYAGLDGLRAIAVGLVLIYHLFPGAGLHSGLVGVDVFFVVSGFLITSLMLRPSTRSRGYRMLDFWRRRARRLLPALAVALTVCASVAWAIGGDVLVGIGRQLLGASTFSYNWVALAGGSDYFAATEPELFRNVWSLAVEEQFYLLWPLLLPLLLVVLRKRWMPVTFAVAAAGASVWWMSVLVASGSVTRAYFGTDSHAFGLLLGIALAFALRDMPDRAWMRSSIARMGGLAIGMLGVALIVVSALQPGHPAGTGFPGTLLLASVGSLLAILAGVVPGSCFGRAIDVQPLRWIGDRSYGIYLWHWPLLVLVLAATGQGVSAGAVGVPVVSGWVALVLAVIAAAVSFRMLETPVRRLGLRRSLRAIGARFKRNPLTRFATLSTLLVALLAMGGATAAVASAPPMTTAEATILAGQKALKKAAANPTPAPEPAPTSIDGNQVTAVGDSVMLASAPALYERFPGAFVDAKVSRSIWKGPRIIDALAASGELRQHVVVALGTNGSIDRNVLQKMADTIGPNRDLVLVNAYAPRDWIPGVNAELQAFAAVRRGVVVADWSGAIAPHEDLLAGDRIHPGASGGRIFAEVVDKGIRDSEAERAARPHRTPEPMGY